MGDQSADATGWCGIRPLVRSDEAFRTGTQCCLSLFLCPCQFKTTSSEVVNVSHLDPFEGVGRLWQ